MFRSIGLILAGLLVTAAGPAEHVGRLATTETLHRVLPGESLSSIGSRYGVDPAVLAADNALRRASRLRVGDQIRISVAHIVPAAATDRVLTINVPQRMLFYRIDEELLAIPVAVGRAGWPTPIAPFTIIETEIDPTWDVPDSIARESAAKGIRLPRQIPPGPDNPLGRYWLRLSVGGVGIHGTNAPASIYQAATHGCIRAHPDDIARLFPLVQVGTIGELIYEPVLLGVDGGEVALEVHRDVYRFGGSTPLQEARRLAVAQQLDDRIDWAAAARVAAAQEGVARVVTRR